MYRKHDPADGMWAHALDLMAQAERMHQQFFRLGSGTRPQANWEPPADVFVDGRDAVIVVALPGVSAERVEIASEPGALWVRAERELPAAARRGAMRQLEIPYGVFERRIPLPEGLWELGAQELSHGCLVLRLRRAS
jgi:HSP20 family protein